MKLLNLENLLYFINYEVFDTNYSRILFGESLSEINKNNLLDYNRAFMFDDACFRHNIFN